jgi:replication factor C small subunit
MGIGESGLEQAKAGDASTMLWAEKYRPRDFTDIQGQEDIVRRVEAFVAQRNLPHLLFAGPAGTGKSSLALVIAKRLYGEGWRQNFFELNSSDERGIETVRIKVKDFARTKAIGDAPFKIIFLDECDALTKDAQQALRRTMENYTQTCRFILAANYSSRLIEPIQSRCAVFRFRPLTPEQVGKVIGRIAQAEGLTVTEEAKAALFEASEGDCRRLANLLQMCGSAGGTVTPEQVYAVSTHAPPKEVRAVLEAALAGDFLKARKDLFDVMLRHGLSGDDIIRQVLKEVWSIGLPPRALVDLIDKAGEIEFRLSEGADEVVQLEALLAQFTRAAAQR